MIAQYRSKGKVETITKVASMSIAPNGDVIVTTWTNYWDKVHKRSAQTHEPLYIDRLDFIGLFHNIRTVNLHEEDRL